MERSLQILLADNGEIFHQTIADYLRDSGHSVNRVHDGSAVLRSFEEHDYDLALLDIRILEPGTLSLLTRIQETCPEMPVAVITGCQDMDTAVQAMRLGAVDFLANPVKLLELDAVLEKSVRNRELAVRCTQVEKALRESEKCYRLLAENVTDVVWITDMNLRSTYVNAAVESMLGYDIAEAMTLEWGKILTPASFEVIRKALAEELAEKETEQDYLFRLQPMDIELLCKDGTTICVEAKCTSLRNSDGQPIGMLGILRDMSGSKGSRSLENPEQAQE